MTNGTIIDFWGLNYSEFQELGNGMWYVMGVQMLFAGFMYLIVTWVDDKTQTRNGRTYIMVPRTAWYVRPDVQLTIAWMTFILGSTIRAHWNWTWRECLNDFGVAGCLHIEQDYIQLLIAMPFAIAGGACVVGRMLPQRWAPWSWIFSMLNAVWIPLVYRYWV